MVVVLLATGLTGCASESGRCIDYIALDSAQARYEAADIVVIAAVESTGHTIDSFAEYPLYRATTVQTVKGRAPRTFNLIAPSDQCERRGEPVEYLEGDPLAHFHRGALYLVKGAQAWQLLTPSSLDPLAADAPLPFSTTSPTPSPSPSTKK